MNNHSPGKDPHSMSKQTPHDPYAEREAEKYENPIPSREFILKLLEEAGKPMYRDEIAETLELETEEQLEAIRRRLRAMERDGQLIFNRRGGYCLVDKLDMVRGRVIGHPDGFGFLVPEEGGDDLFLSAKQMHAVLHGDKVLARVSGVDRRGRREGAVVQVLEHANHEVVGRYFIDQGVGFVVADNKRLSQDILVPEEHAGGAVDGQFVVVEIYEYPTQHRQAMGRIINILGEHMAPGMEIDIAIRAHEIPNEWPAEVDAAIDALSDEVPESAKTEEGRRDIRHLALVTIDGEDSKDFDDAVYAEADGDGWRLVVAIADVSHYVKPGSALDVEAYERGNSTYFPGRVVPMLPELLSNGLCSINPKVDRLCMVADMRVNAEGEMTAYEFYPAVMNSHARLTYNKVAAMLIDSDPALCAEYSELLPHLHNLYFLYQALHKRRVARGAIDFDTTETKIEFGSHQKIERIVAVHRNDAHRLIEECMLLANTATAKMLEKAGIPIVYRIHETPKLEKLEALREFLSELGLSLGGGDKPEARDYAKLLGQVGDRPDAHLIQTVMLRSMMQAVYSPDNIGHFGLAFDAYTHFTSPIRRYPDLLVHRAIRHVISGKGVEKFRYSHHDMEQMGEHCSMTERRSDEATRNATDWLKCEYMLDKIGDEFDGTISSVTGFGLFVELDEIYVEGLVHVTNLPNDYYHFDPVKHRMVGERSGQRFRLGDRVRVKVARVDMDERKIDFDMS